MNFVNFRQKHRRSRSAAALLAVLALLAALLVNAVVSILPDKLTKFDVSGVGMTEISPETRRFLNTLREDVTVTWLCEGEMTDPQLELLLSRYEEASAHITVEVVDPLTHPDYAASYKRGSISNYSLVVSSARRVRSLDASGFYFYTNEYINSLYQQEVRMTAEEFQYYYTYAGQQMAAYESRMCFDGEALLTAAMDYVTSETIPHAYLLTGLGNDNAFSATLQGLLAAMDVGVKTLDINNATAIPEDADCLLLPNPTIDLSDKATALVEAHLGRGGSLMLTTAPSALTSCPNILRLCEGFGLSATVGLVVEGNLDFTAGNSTDVLVPGINTQHAALQYVSNSGYKMQMPRAHAIAIAETLPARVSAVKMFTTSEKARVVELGNVSTTIGATGTYCVGAAAQKTVTLPDGTAGTAGLTWWASAEVLTDEVAQSTSGGSYYYYAATVRFMSRGFTSPYESIAPVTLTSPGLSELNDISVVLIAALVVVVIPAALVGLGIAVYIRRKRA